jgi:excisionase family DNA binding protein
MTRISIREAAAQFGVSRRTLERWVRDGRLTAIPDARDGRQRLVDPETVELLIKQMPKRRGKSKTLETRDELRFADDDLQAAEQEPTELRDRQAIDMALLQVYRQHRRLITTLDPDTFHELTLQELRGGPLGRDLERLAAYAQGQVYDDSRLALSAVESVLQVLFWPAAAKDYTIPRPFWDTDLGRLLSRAQLRAYTPNELVSIDDAARMCGVTTPTIYRWLDDRTLGWVRDDVNGRTWVVRRDVVNIKRVAAELAGRQAMPERALAS